LSFSLKLDSALSTLKSHINSLTITIKLHHFFWSQGKLNEIYFEFLSQMKISRSLIDFKIDMYPDSNELNITANIPSTLIRSIKVLMFNNYAIRERISVNMICMALAKKDTPKVHVLLSWTILLLQQRSLLNTSEITSTKLKDTALVNSSAAENSLGKLIVRLNDTNLKN